jgi:hypothetical protein
VTWIRQPAHARTTTGIGSQKETSRKQSVPISAVPVLIPMRTSRAVRPTKYDVFLPDSVLHDFASSLISTALQRPSACPAVEQCNRALADEAERGYCTKYARSCTGEGICGRPLEERLLQPAAAPAVFARADVQVRALNRHAAVRGVAESAAGSVLSHDHRDNWMLPP